MVTVLIEDQIMKVITFLPLLMMVMMMVIMMVIVMMMMMMGSDDDGDSITIDGDQW
jgi:hypothetical protein